MHRYPQLSAIAQSSIIVLEHMEDSNQEEFGMTQEGDTSIDPELSWQASEYLHHKKPAAWYIGLFAIVAGLVAIAFFTRQWLSIAVFAVMAVTLAVYAHKAPRVLDYALDDHGVTIDRKFYPYTSFRSFAVIQDVGWHLIDLEPTQRFMPRLNILFEDDKFDAIVSVLRMHLPESDRQPDWIERLTRYLKF